MWRKLLVGIAVCTMVIKVSKAQMKKKKTTQIPQNLAQGGSIKGPLCDEILSMVVGQSVNILFLIFRNMGNSIASTK